MTATFGNAQEGGFYGLLAGISSFMFQLPFQLIFSSVILWKKRSSGV
jgi:hypothetical protein